MPKLVMRADAARVDEAKRLVVEARATRAKMDAIINELAGVEFEIGAAIDLYPQHALYKRRALLNRRLQAVYVARAALRARKAELEAWARAELAFVARERDGGTPPL